VEAAVKHALKVGYRHIDCAYGYGNETEVGKALEYGIKELKFQERKYLLPQNYGTFFTNLRMLSPHL